MFLRLGLNKNAILFFAQLKQENSIYLSARKLVKLVYNSVPLKNKEKY
jgi:hypothetical protein